MVLLPDVQTSNSLISYTLPPGLVAVFVGATSGIGEITLKKFAHYVSKPRAYFIGRSQEAGDRIAAECRKINPAGHFEFIKADVSLIRNVDEVCAAIKEKEKELNLLVLSQGVPSFDRSKTAEDIHLLAALIHYSRLRFITNLLPLLQTASSLRRVVSVGGGGHEGPVDTTDFPALRIPMTKLRGHLVSCMTLSLEAIALTAPEVSFVHNYPGTVDTNLARRAAGFKGVVLRAYIRLLGRWVCVPVDECGERELYLATSARFPPVSGGEGKGFAVPVGDGLEIGQRTAGHAGGAVYSVGWDGESASLAALDLLAELRDSGLVDEVWKHTESEFKRVTEP